MSGHIDKFLTDLTEAEAPSEVSVLFLHELKGLGESGLIDEVQVFDFALRIEQLYVLSVIADVIAGDDKE